MTKTKTKKTAAKAKTTTKAKAPITKEKESAMWQKAGLDKAFAETPMQIRANGHKIQEKTATSRQSAYYPVGSTSLSLPDKVALLRAYAYALETDTLRVSQAYGPTYAQRDYMPLLRDGDTLSVRIGDAATAPLAHGYSALTFGPGTDAKSAPASDDYDA